MTFLGEAKLGDGALVLNDVGSYAGLFLRGDFSIFAMGCSILGVDKFCTTCEGDFIVGTCEGDFILVGTWEGDFIVGDFIAGDFIVGDLTSVSEDPRALFVLGYF